MKTKNSTAFKGFFINSEALKSRLQTWQDKCSNNI